jgi:hypothetical protein
MLSRPKTSLTKPIKANKRLIRRCSNHKKINKKLIKPYQRSLKSNNRVIKESNER